MAVLFDAFSYRVNKTPDGLYYDRWYGNMFPEISMPEKLYFLDRIISALLTHNKLFIRTDSIEEMIECIGFDAFRMLYNRGELEILDNWWVPSFTLCKHMHLTAHAFQRSKIKSISLPDHITNLPEYVFFDCPNLASILAIGVIKIYFNALRNCNSLEHLKFAEEFHTDNIDRYFNDDDYDTSRCGIEIGKDDIYSYIWCLTNFKFYYTERLSDEWSNRIFSFNHMNRRSFLMFFGDIDIYSNYKDHYASNISEGFLKTSSRYTKITHNGIYVGSEDLQKNPIKYYYEVDKRLKTDIRDVIKQIEEEVDKLDINSIIDSYETTISEWTKTKIGDDDTFYSETHRCSYYSDAYLETILPSYHS